MKEHIFPVTNRWNLKSSCGPVWITSSKVGFRIWAPHAEKVMVQFENGNSHELIREEKSPHFFSAEIESLKSGDRYRVVLNSSWNDCYQSEGTELIRRDPNAREVDFDSNWCVLIEPFFLFEKFNAPAYNKLIIYELHIGSFHPQMEGKSPFEVTTEYLHHIKNLEFNCIELMPVTEFGGIWGYNPRQLLTVHGKWGSAYQLKELINRAHLLGLSVIIDIVLNHGSAKLNSLWNWDGFGPQNNGGIYFEGEIDTKWGRRFAFHKNEVKDYLKGAARMWLEEYNVDGLRFDSVHNMPWSLLQEITYEIKEHYPGKILIAEITPENSAVITEAGFDSCWIHAAHYDSLKIMKGHDGGSDPSIRLSMLKSMGNIHNGFPNSCSAINSVLGSHDQCGDRHSGHDEGGIHRYYIDRLGGRDNWHARAQVRMWYAIQGMSRPIPMVFMGTEILQSQWWHVDNDHRFNWNLIKGEDHFAAHMMNCVRDINKLRLSNSAFTSENIRFVHEDAKNSTLGWIRSWESGDGAEEVYLCVAHIDESEWSVCDYGLFTGMGANKQWVQVFNSQSEKYGGWGGSWTSGTLISDSEGKIKINLPKWSLLVFNLKKNI